MVYNLDKYTTLSKNARNRLKWMDYYRECDNVAKTCRHFGISRKIFYKWHNVFDPENLFTLEDKSKTPINTRKREITQLEEDRVIALRKRNLCYSKFKLEKLYLQEYGQWISSWKIQNVIQKHNLYPNKTKTQKITRKRLKAKKKERITKLKKQKQSGFLLCLDTVQLRKVNDKRYVFTGLDHLQVFDHYYNKITLGGNILDNSSVIQPPNTDGRFYYDDVIVNDSRIGPTYFSTLASFSAPADLTPPSAPSGLLVN